VSPAGRGCFRAAPLTNQASPKHKNVRDSANSSKGTVLPADGRIAVKSASNADSAMPPAQATKTLFWTRRCLTANSPFHHARILRASCLTGNSVFHHARRLPRTGGCCSALEGWSW